jgi:hypothetical protein
MKCKKCDYDVDVIENVSAIDIDMLEFFGCDSCKGQYLSKFKSQLKIDESLAPSPKDSNPVKGKKLF